MIASRFLLIIILSIIGVLGLLVRIGLSIWAYKDATKRSYDENLAALLTVFLGLIGFLIYLGLRTKTKTDGNVY